MNSKAMFITARSLLLFLFALAVLFPPVAFSDRTHEYDHFQAVNVDRVNDDIFRGGQPYLDDFDKLKAMNIQTIINFKVDEDPDERDAVNGLRFQYVRIPWNPSPSQAARYDYDDIASRFLETVSNEENLPAYVHCHLGRDRAGSMIAVYRMEKDGWTAEEAIREMEEFGFRRTDYPNLVRFLKSREKQAAVTER
jgi:protein tyrosine/serine phosphatase